MCNQTDGTCNCFSDPLRGFWAGGCDICAVGWSGPQCLSACPVGRSGSPCSGFRCADGVCLCDEASCGLNCDLSGPSCSVLVCPVGRYGANCSRSCPAENEVPCAGHGNRRPA